MPEQTVRQVYLDDIQASSALKQAFLSLLSRPVLPENPYYFLADFLLAHNDLSCSALSGLLISELHTCTKTWADANKSICTFADCAFGLPHVMMFCTSTGLKALHHVCLHSLSDALFCQSPAPCQADNKGSTLRSICSISGKGLLYLPSWNMLPDIRIRSDVLIASNVIDDAIDAFALSILRDCRSVKRMPLNTWIDVKVLAASSDTAKLQIHTMTALQVETDTASFMLMVRRAVLSSQVVQASFVVAVELPGTNTSTHEASTVFAHTSKAYHLHIQSSSSSMKTAFIDADSITHYTEPALAAAYTGIFLDVVAARIYLALYNDLHSDPYDAKDVNADAILADCRSDLSGGRYMDGLCKYMHHALLNSTILMSAVKSQSSLPDWAAILSARQGNLSVEVLNSVGTVMASSSSQLTCLADAIWCMLQSFTRLATSAADEDSVHIFPHLTAFTRRLGRLGKYLMEAGLFSGLSVIAVERAEALVQATHESRRSTVVTQIVAGLECLELLMRMAASTSASAILLHCTELMRDMRRLQLLNSEGIHVSAVATNSRVQWKLPVQEACARETFAGRLPDMHASEGVHLQYAVDTRLDDLLALVFQAVTEPPLLDKPFCRILNVVRVQGKGTELWAQPCEILTMRVTNSVNRVGPCNCFVYAGRPSKACIQAWRDEATQHALKSLWSDLRPGELRNAVVYGSYTAVQYADALMLHRLAESIPLLMAGMSTQTEGYDVKMTCSFMGDAALSGCIDWTRKSDMIQGQLVRADVKQQRSVWYPYNSPRFSNITIEHMYIIEGPSATEAVIQGVTTIWKQLNAMLLYDSYCIVFISFGGRVISKKSFNELGDGVLKLLIQHVQALTLSPGDHTCEQIEACKLLLCASVSSGQSLPILLSCQMRCMVVGRRHESESGQPKHWGDDVYSRVFMSYAAASTWWRYNRSQGCPSQPFHLQSFVSRGRRKAQALAESRKEYVSALKCSAMVEAALQNHRGVVVHTRCAPGELFV
eukprot:jgi/Ulvmu1/4905/UM020_0191.1